MRINNNLMAMNTHRQLGINANNGAKSIEKLSSGYRINRAGDDAAGLAISEKMRGQIRGLTQASRNAQDGISLIQTAEGALNESHAILQRMRELGVQSATDTNTSDDRAKLQSEVDQLAKELTRISNTTEFNTKNLLAGGMTSTFHVGANADQNVDLSIGAMDAQSLGVAGALVTTAFTNTNTGVTSISTTSSNVGGQYVSITKTAAGTGAVTQSDATAGAGTANVTAWTGSADATFQVKATGISGGGDVASASYSTDGGNTWTNASVAVTAGTSSVITLQDGATLTVAFDAQNSNDDTWTFAATAETLSFRLNSLANGTGTTIGNTVVAHNNQSSVTIGSDSTAQAVTVNFDFNTVKAAIAVAGTYEGDQITQTTSSSTAAVIGADGKVSTAADTKKGIDITSQANANTAITTINSALEKVSAERSKLGAAQNRLEHTIKNLDTSAENLQASESRIRDVDMAKEMMNFTKNNILQQAAQAMLAQANQAPQGVLQLLR